MSSFRRFFKIVSMCAEVLFVSNVCTATFYFLVWCRFWRCVWCWLWGVLQCCCAFLQNIFLPWKIIDGLSNLYLLYILKNVVYDWMMANNLFRKLVCCWILDSCFKEYFLTSENYWWIVKYVSVIHSKKCCVWLNDGKQLISEAYRCCWILESCFNEGWWL